MQPKRPPQLVIVDIPDELATPLADTLDKMRDRSFETMREVCEREEMGRGDGMCVVEKSDSTDPILHKCLTYVSTGDSVQ